MSNGCKAKVCATCPRKICQSSGARDAGLRLGNFDSALGVRDIRDGYASTKVPFSLTPFVKTAEIFPVWKGDGNALV
jgi:hypothetical protein